jgi:hypothetical protein
MAANPYVATEASTVVLTLHADHTVTGERLSDPTDRCDLKFIGSWTLTCQSSTPGAGVTWRYENGFLIISEPGDEDARLLLGAGGRMFLGGGTSNFLPGHSWSVMVAGMRLPN